MAGANSGEGELRHPFFLSLSRFFGAVCQRKVACRLPRECNLRRRLSHEFRISKMHMQGGEPIDDHSMDYGYM